MKIGEIVRSLSFASASGMRNVRAFCRLATRNRHVVRPPYVRVRVP